MKHLLVLLLVLNDFSSFSQKDYEKIWKENQEYRAELNAQYKDSLHSPLKRDARLKFDSFPFYSVDTAYYVVAKFVKSKRGKSFKMKTSTTRKPKYKVYGKVVFTIKDTVYELNVYQNKSFINNPEYKDYLFLPFKDFTNGNETYGGGRYLDLKIPEGETLILDFNKAYNPYCAYTYGYSCPVPPRENSLNTYIEAGIKYEENQY